MIVKDSNRPIIVGLKILADSRISNATIGFYCRIFYKANFENYEVSLTDEAHLEELEKYGYATSVDGIYFINP